MMRALFFLLSLLIVASVLGSAFMALIFIDSTATNYKRDVVFDVRPGQTLRSVAKELHAAKLVASDWKFYWYARFKDADNRIRVGEYALHTQMRPREVLDVITSGRSIERSLTIQEGFNIFEIADQLERQGFAKRDEFLQLARDPKLVRQLLGEDLSSLEGYLFPETYKVTKFTGTQGLIRLMVNRFLAVYKELPAHGMTRHQLVTLASIVEKETGAPEERPIISSVFHNRMQKGMRLETDPTVIYGIFFETGRWNRNISRADLLRDGPYNTYRRSGLPPGPIANPGREALLAAIAPAKTEFLFFVSRNDGTHVFSKDFRSHQQAVQNYQLDRRNREGKSWRDLKNRPSTGGVPAATPPPAGRGTGTAVQSR